HLRRDNPRRRGREGPDRGVRRHQTDGSLRGPPGRDERRRGSPAPAGGRAAERARRPDDERGRRDGGRAGRRRARGSAHLMAILVDERTRLAVAGITGREGSFHTLNNRRYGTNVVGGVTPGKGGQDVEGIPVFDGWAQAMEEVQPNTAMIFVPPR